MQEEIVEAEFEEITEDRPTVNVGTPGHIDHDVDTMEAPQADTEAPVEQGVKMSKAEIVKTLTAAVENDQLDRKTAARIRSEMCIFQSDFTKKRETDAKRKAKRKLQKKARRKQRK